MSVSINDTYKQLPDFLALGAKKIVSFGGWGYSTDPATYNALRAAMNPGNVDTFATNIANFVNSQGFDGVDIDWEYPGAPDIPGIPAGLATDGPNYLSFLRALRKKLATGKSLSIAAPASYWYLKSFPIAEMSKLVDYIVYMTYDLHGESSNPLSFQREDTDMLDRTMGLQQPVESGRVQNWKLPTQSRYVPQKAPKHRGEAN